MKKHHLKSLLSLMLLISMCSILLFPNTSEAKGNIGDSQILASYDIEKGGTQIFNVTDQEGNDVIITIQEVDGKEKIENGSYQVTYAHTLFWTAGFTVTISNNKITKAYSPFYKVVLGSISTPSLTLNSSAKATYKFIYKSGLSTTTTGVVATISGTTLEVSKI